MKPYPLQFIGRILRPKQCRDCYLVFAPNLTSCPSCRKEHKMKKPKKVKLTKDQKTIQELQQKLNSAECSLRSSQYRETEADKKIQKLNKEISDCNNYHHMTSKELNSMTANVNNALNELQSCDMEKVSVEALQRVIGIAQGKLEAAVGITKPQANTCSYDASDRLFMR
jgi:septal ring factor EnvC (AmiA/AmiB activator)